MTDKNVSRVFADRLSRGDQLNVGATVFAGDYLWRHAGKLTQARIWLFGRRTDITHLGVICRIHWWREQPYLVSIRKAG